MFEYQDILNIEKMVKFYILASIVSLFPLASLRPGHLTKFKVTLYLIPPIIITTIGICYLLFNGETAALDSVSQIGSHIDKFDIQLRLVIFLFTIVEAMAESTISPLFQSIENYLEDNYDYTNSTFSLESFSKSIHESETDISHAIKSAGYSGFKEYINKLRLEHFRHLILLNSQRITKELWIECGFPCRGTFYRQFSLVYNESL